MTKPALLTMLIAAVPLAVGGCSLISGPKEIPPCPPIYILGDAGKLTKYRPGPGRDLTDVEYEAEIYGYQGGCSYDEKGAKVDIQVTLAVKRGPANADRKASLTYFTAIPYFYPSPEAKAEFTVQTSFPEGVNSVRVTDEPVYLQVPVKDKDVINKYEIYLGFQASEEELLRNRKSR